MSGRDQAELQVQTPAVAMLLTLGGIAMIAGLLVVGVFEWTKPIIEENKRIAIEQAIFKVIPNAATRVNFILGPDGPERVDNTGQAGAGEIIYAAYDGAGELQGIAMETAATGYQDVIRILYGYDPRCECVTGIKVLKMAETPGLGDKIAFDPEFLANFTALDGRLNASKSALEHPIEAVKHGSKTEPWQIDSISGATISSKAIARMINSSGQRMFPLIHEHLAVLQGDGQ